MDFSLLTRQQARQNTSQTSIYNHIDEFVLLTLWGMKGIGPQTIQCLLPLLLPQNFGSTSTPMSLEALRNLNQPQLQALGLQKTQINSLKHHQNYDLALGIAEATLEWGRKANQTVIIIGQSNYPEQLLELAVSPPVLLIKGRVDVLSQPSLALVGSRNPSNEGQQNAAHFAQAIARAGLVVVSGGAAGIDAIAHEQAMHAQGLTLAVLGHGIDSVYPKHHAPLFEKITAQGALISEFPLGVTPRPEYFPRRNRIISGLSRGVCVIEAALKSGSLSTARWAMEQGREVFAVPGSIHNPRARGCHELIKNGAKLIESAEDIFEEFHDYELPHKNQAQPFCLAETTSKNLKQEMPNIEGLRLEQAISLLIKWQPMTVAILSSKLPEYATQDILGTLTILELEGMIHYNAQSGYYGS